MRAGLARALVASAASVCALGIGWLTCTPFYDTNDDPAMRLIAEGRLGPATPPQPLLLFINPLLGELVVAANQHWPGPPWYDLLLVALELTAASATVFVLARRPTLPAAAALFGFLLVFWIVPFVRLQFSVVAGHLAVAGCLVLGGLLADVAGPPGRRAALACVGVGLVGVGALLRWNAVLVVLAVAVGLALPLLVQYGRRSRGAWLKAAAALILTVGCVDAVRRLDAQWYAGTPGWEHFHAHNKLRGEITEFLPDTALTSEKRQGILTAAGWSENDFQMLRHWFFTDRDTFGTDRLARAAAALRTDKAQTPGRLISLLEEVWAAIGREGVASAFAFAPLVGLGFLGLRRIGYALYGTVVVVASVAVLAFLFKVPPFRIFWPLLTLHAAFVLLHDGGSSPRGLIRAVPLILAGLVSAIPIYHELITASAHRTALARAAAADVARLADPRRIRYVILGAGFPYEHYFRALQPTPPEARFRFIGLGVGNLTPLVQDFLDREGIRDLALALCTDERLRFIGPGGPIIEQFVGEHFGLIVRMRLDFEGRTFRAYRCDRIA